MKKLLIALTISVMTTGAFAHSKVDTMTPADGSVVDIVPEFVDLDFSKAIRLTKVEMNYADKHTKVLDLGEQKAFLKKFSVPLVGMGSGAYKINWRGLGEDGHAMKGEFTFEVK